MRGRLLMMFTALAAICMTYLAGLIGWYQAASATRGLVIDRIHDADRFAALSAGDPAELRDEAQSYHDRRDSGVLVIDAKGIVVCYIGIDGGDPRVIDVVQRARRFEPPQLPENLLPWGPRTILIAQTVGTPPRAAGAVVIVASTAETRAEITDAWIQLACITASMLLVFGGVALVLSGWILRPVSELLRNVDALTATLPAPGGGPRRAPGKGDGPPEIRELSDAVEAMTLAVAELAAAERRHVADTAHSMRNPLAALAVRLDALRPALDGSEAESTFDSVVAEVDRLTGLLDGLLADAVAESRTECGATESATVAAACDAVAVAVDRVEAWHAAFARAGMALTIELLAHGAPVAVPEQILRQILDVALSNSSRYAGSGAHATLTVSREFDSVVVSVSDTGTGVSEEEIDRLTTRFFRGANAAAGGSGLGLPIAATLAVKHGGLLFIDAADPHGLVVTVSFPAATDDMESTEADCLTGR
ncbi:sensor histidine kinase [Nocardia sp. NPDC051570]|uniref:sensor histidine kinase n=1 Tax=Nocardia sp. NPDC051570 TaxID=3364324 RepID=UPI003799606E